MGQTRGRRREKKDKKKVEENLTTENELDADFIPLEPVQDEDSFSEPVRDNRSSFFGLLDRSELEYFKNAENILATNALTHEEHGPFVSSVFTEAKGKELKLATNQVCSKLFERLVQLSDDEQTLQLMSAVEPFVVDLAYQKFSSHCLEAIFVKAIPLESCEELVASSARKLGSVGSTLATDKYASHVISTVILSLSGLNENMRSKKSQLARKHTEIEEQGQKQGSSNGIQESQTAASEIPQALRSAAREIVTSFVNSLEKVEARKMAINNVSSSVIQALIMCEATLMSSYKLVELLVLSEDSSGFVSHCSSDAVGCHFLETVVKILPAKKATKFVDTLPLAKLSADNEASTYLVQTVISQSSISRHRKIEILRNELKDAIGQNFNIGIAALDLDFGLAAREITDGLDFETLDLRDTRRSALFEKLSRYDPFLEKAVDSIIAMDDISIGKMGVDPTQSYVLQSLLHASAPVIARRKLLNKLVIHIPQFVVNAFGSHIVDSLWSACYKLKFARERIASELLKIEEQVKHSPYGRKVWKNWQMEKYSRKRHEWWQIVKSEEDALRAQLEPGKSHDDNKKPDLREPSTKRRKMPNRK